MLLLRTRDGRLPYDGGMGRVRAEDESVFGVLRPPVVASKRPSMYSLVRTLPPSSSSRATKMVLLSHIHTGKKRSSSLIRGAVPVVVVQVDRERRPREVV